MPKYMLQISEGGGWTDVREYDDYEDAAEGAGKLFDLGEQSDFRIFEPIAKHGTIIYPHRLIKDRCPICGKEVRRRNEMQTYDCHGIPYRYVCPDCYDKTMEEKGYDGEYYTAADECIDYEY